MYLQHNTYMHIYMLVYTYISGYKLWNNMKFTNIKNSKIKLKLRKQKIPVKYF